jgi:hypothetical protein
VLLSLEPVKAVITASSALVLVGEGADSVLGPLKARLAAIDLHQSPVFELAALEALLITLLAHYNKELRQCKEEGERVLRSLRKNVSSRLLNRTLGLKKQLDLVHEAVLQGSEALEELQEDEDLMRRMSLSEMQRDPDAFALRLAQGDAPCEQVELLIDAYAHELSSIAAQARPRPPGAAPACLRARGALTRAVRAARSSSRCSTRRSTRRRRCCSSSLTPHATRSSRSTSPSASSRSGSPPARSSPPTTA